MRISLTSGCKIKFTESVYTEYKENQTSDFIGERTIIGRITAEDYSNKGLHFFTIHVYSSSGINAIESNIKIIRRGSVVYPKMEIISYPDNYDQLLEDKELRKIGR